MTMPVNMTRLSPGFPNVIGAIDCRHIAIKAPLGPNEGDFENQNGVLHSINVQARFLNFSLLIIQGNVFNCNTNLLDGV